MNNFGDKAPGLPCLWRANFAAFATAISVISIRFAISCQKDTAVRLHNPITSNQFRIAPANIPSFGTPLSAYLL
jgi:hypothetical protein